MQTKFLRNLKASNPSKSTITNIEYVLKTANEFIKKPLDTATWDDLLCYIEHLQAEGYKHSTIALHKSKLKQFYIFCFDETDKSEYRKIAKRLSDTIDKKALNPQDILTVEDIKRLLNVATHEHERVIIASLFESGMRVGELLNLRVKDVQLEEPKEDQPDKTKYEVIFHIPDMPGSKTGARSVLCVEIYGYVQDWLKCHPNPAPNEKFITNIGTKFGVSQMLKRVFRRAGIEKPCNPHILRHSAITHAVAMGMQETAIKERFWGNIGSMMLTTYVHLNQQMQSDAYKNAKGINNNEKSKSSIAVHCVTCGRLVQSGKLCPQCADIQRLTEANTKASFENQDLRVKMENFEKIMEDMMEKRIEEKMREYKKKS